MGPTLNFGPKCRLFQFHSLDKRSCNYKVIICKVTEIAVNIAPDYSRIIIGRDVCRYFKSVSFYQVHMNGVRGPVVEIRAVALHESPE